MKINWGVGITIFLILFLGTVAWRIYLAGINPVDLVSEDYYPKSLEYKHQIAREENTAKSNYHLTVVLENKKLILKFPENTIADSIAGVCHFYRPSDNALDKFVPIKVDTAHLQVFNVTDFTKGKYELKVYWTLNSVEYYFENEVLIP
ncbi:MAG TPA: hypothetical protein DCQ31_10755 [Bacteroidales bacterium]|nr:hypothetical protein [Bacteroidales bacterium]